MLDKYDAVIFHVNPRPSGLGQVPTLMLSSLESLHAKHESCV